MLGLGRASRLHSEAQERAQCPEYAMRSLPRKHYAQTQHNSWTYIPCNHY